MKNTGMRSKTKSLQKKMQKKEIRIGKSICHFNFDYFFIGVIKQPICPPTMMTFFVLWNGKFNHYKEQCLKLVMGKHKFKSYVVF